MTTNQVEVFLLDFQTSSATPDCRQEHEKEVQRCEEESEKAHIVTRLSEPEQIC